MSQCALSHWLIKVAALAAPVYQLLRDEIEQYGVVYADETTAQVLDEPNRRPEQKGYMWCLLGGPPDKRRVVYHYDPGRGHGVRHQLLPDFQGYLHCDGHGAYDVYARQHPKVRQVGCWAHARRQFIEAQRLTQSKGLAHRVIGLVAKLYAIEKRCRITQLKPEHRYDWRQRHARPLLHRLHELLLAQQGQVLPRSQLGKAVQYTLNQWPKLMRYLDDGRLEIDNNRAERAIKPFVIGRKNWLFSQSTQGVVASQRLFSLVETAKANGLERYQYLRFLFTRLPYARCLEDFEALLPCKHLNLHC